MNPMSEDPNFTGSRSQYVVPEVIQYRIPFRVSISMVDNFTAGKVKSTYFDWHVTLNGERVAYRDIYKNPPKTRKAAITQARAAIRNYCEFLTSNIHKQL